MVTSYQAHKEATNLQTIISGVQQLYANQQNFNGLTTDVVRNARIAPQQMLTGSPTGLVNSFGAKVEVNVYGSEDFYVEIEDIPPDVCVKFFTLVYKMPSVDRMFINDDMSISTSKPLDVARLATACNKENSAEQIFLIIIGKN